jgi:hypothetical protein
LIVLARHAPARSGFALAVQQIGVRWLAGQALVLVAPIFRRIWYSDWFSRTTRGRVGASMLSCLAKHFTLWEFL